MKNSRILEMLNENRINELKAELQDEIFTESLIAKPNAKKRYAAMKKYLKSSDSAREILQKPCELEVYGDMYNVFCNAYTLALTTESCGEIPMCDEPDRYPKLTHLVNYDGDEETIDINRVLAEAKSKGYKFKKNMIHSNDYLMHYAGAYFRIGLIDITYGIINDGKEVTAFRKIDSDRKPLTIKNDIGTCVIMPVRIEDGPGEESVVIEVE